MITAEQFERLLYQLEYVVSDASYETGGSKVRIELDFDSKRDAASFIHILYENGLDNAQTRCSKCGHWLGEKFDKS